MIEKKTIKGIKGVTLCYTICNPRLEGNLLKWDAFRFYTPSGNMDDGDKYYDIPAENVSLEQDSILSKKLQVIVLEGNIDVVELLEGAQRAAPLQIGLNGDVIITAYIPSQGDIIVTYKEIVHEVQETPNG
jgi:hypothetical protein